MSTLPDQTIKPNTSQHSLTSRNPASSRSSIIADDSEVSENSEVENITSQTNAITNISNISNVSATSSQSNVSYNLNKNTKTRGKPSVTKNRNINVEGITLKEMTCRLASTSQENKCLSSELEVYKLRFRQLIDENKRLRNNNERVHVRDKYEEEMISNALLKKIQELKKEKETLVHDYENEEECLTNDLSRKLMQLRNEKSELERTLEMEQQKQVGKLLRRIDRMEKEMTDKQMNLDKLKHEKVDLEQTLEKEQEALVNKLWKKMDKLEKEKRILQQQLNQPMSLPPSPIPDGFIGQGYQGIPPSSASVNNLNCVTKICRIRQNSMTQSGNVVSQRVVQPNSNNSSIDRKRLPSMERQVDRPLSSQSLGKDNLERHNSINSINGIFNNNEETDKMSLNVRNLRREVAYLKTQLKANQAHHLKCYERISVDERQLRDENQKLRDRLKMEKERSERLCRALSESESSLDSSWMEWETTSASGYEYLKDPKMTKPNQRTISSPQTHPGVAKIQPKDQQYLHYNQNVNNNNNAIISNSTFNSITLPTTLPNMGSLYIGSNQYNLGLNSQNLISQPRGADECSVISESGSELDKILCGNEESLLQNFSNQYHSSKSLNFQQTTQDNLNRSLSSSRTNRHGSARSSLGNISVNAIKASQCIATSYRQSPSPSLNQFINEQRLIQPSYQHQSGHASRNSSTASPKIAFDQNYFSGDINDQKLSVDVETENGIEYVDAQRITPTN